MSVSRFLSASLLIFFVLYTSVHAELIAGRVVRVTDGDTLTLLDATNRTHKIRLAGIDAPEKRQDFGQKATAGLSTSIYGRAVLANCPKKDRYHRDVCVVSVDGKDVGLQQVREGFAWWYRHYARDQSPRERDEYEKAECGAKANRLGLWGGKNPLSPWDWRRRGVGRLQDVARSE